MTRDIEDIYPLTPMQQGMLFHALLAPESGAYMEQTSATLSGDFNAEAFVQAWQRVLDRHAALRAGFVWEEVDEPVQVIHRKVTLPLESHDWRDLPAEEQEARLAELRAAQRFQPFDLGMAPLLRLALVRLDEGRWEFIWTHHHLLLDGWSSPILLGEVFTAYEAFKRGKPIALPPRRPYRDYIAWLKKRDVGESEAFWRRALAGFAAPSALVVDHMIEDGEPERYCEQETWLSPEATSALQALARQNQLTMSTFVQGAWGILLGRYGRTNDVLFGVTVSGRPADLAGAESMVGLFINTIPVRAHPEVGQSVLDYLRRIQTYAVEARQYEYTPLVQVQGWSEIGRDAPLFESIIVFENFPVDSALKEQKSSIRVDNVRSAEQTNYPLTIVSGVGSSLLLKIAYDGRRFDDATVARMLGHLRMLAEAMTSGLELPLAALPMLSEPEAAEINAFSRGPVVHYPGAPVHHLFESRAADTPGAVALVVQTEGASAQYTYAELNARANTLGARLKAAGVTPGTIVGLHLERSLDLLAGLLAILKAGAAYLPLDPRYPPERLAFMLRDSGAPFVLTERTLFSGISTAFETATAPRPVYASETAETGGPVPDICVELEPDALAYVIYTSGSTGQPKGVMVTHRSLANHAHAIGKALAMQPGDAMLQFVSISFDAAGEEIYPALLSGATLAIPNEAREALGAQLADFCEQHAVTHLHMPAQVWSQWTDDLNASRQRLSIPLKLLLLGGDSPDVERLHVWEELLGRPVRLINAYGPTEATITAALFETSSDEVGQGRLPIGRPIANAAIRVLDGHGRPAPLGVPGEIVIGGAGVALGYLNQAELTADRFFAETDPSTGAPVRWYRTGDLGRWLPDGNLEFSGRVDDQVKIRGFRVEPGEVETVLAQHPSVRSAIVVARPGPEGRDKRLVAYFVPVETAETTALRSWLAARLPDYMVPTAFVALPALPLTTTGKLDRRALPEPDADLVPGDAFAAPRNPDEELLAGIWARVLNTPRPVGIYDNFFELGGHSLLATQTISRVREAFGLDVPVRALFDHPTVAELATEIHRLRWGDAGRVATTLIPLAPRNAALPLSFGQQRLWFLDQLEPGLIAYNTPVVVRLEGRLDVTALQAAAGEIVRRHEVLRTTFDTAGGKPVQVISPEPNIPFAVVDLTSLPPTEREPEALRQAREELRKPFDLAAGPVLRAVLLRLEEDQHLLAFTVHHIAADGVSLGVLVAELTELYAAFSAGQPSPLPELPLQYADYAYWQRKVLDEAGDPSPLQPQLAYWKEQLSGLPPLLALPTDRPRPAVQTSNGATYNFRLPAELAEKLSAMSRREGVTLYMALLAAYQTLLARYAGQTDVAVGSVVANRPRPELEQLIGFFVNTLVFRTKFDGPPPGPSFREVLRRVRETVLGAFAHQDTPFETLVDLVQTERNMSHTPLFQAAFSLQNFEIAARETPGLSLQVVDIEQNTAQFDMLLTFMQPPPGEKRPGLAASWEYNTDLFDRATIERMATGLETLLQAALAEPDQPVFRLPLIHAGERQRILVDWNRTEIAYPDHCTIHALIEEQAAANPGAPAVVFAVPGEADRSVTLSYGELNARANRLAAHLRTLGVGPNVLAGIMVERSPEMIVGILGILKAGGAYLPLDPAYPADRLAFMISDSGIKTLLTQSHLVREGSQTLDATLAIIELDALPSEIEALPAANPFTESGADTLAYCIYTSGSTGRPKGTLLRHRGLCNLADVHRREFDMGPGKRVLQFSPFSFDASVWETVMALRNGATLVLTRQEVLASGIELLRLLREQRITTVTLPPSLLSVLSPGDLPDLVTVIAAGEKCTNEIVAKWSSAGRRFFNAYGPTETTVCASMHLADPSVAWPFGGPPIGKAISNLKLYVVDPNGDDAHLQAQPIGVPGELLIGGVGLAAGYLNRSELTAQRFIRDPFALRAGFAPASPAGDRVYRTGDLVRWLPDGNLEFMGRIDDQVKLRGFRIELGEVESALREHPGIRDAVVAVRNDMLVGYIITAEETAPSTSSLREHLRSRLPDYMTPPIFITMEAFPLSPAGKVDRRALPAPDESHRELRGEYVAPRTALEQQLAGLCEELLKLAQVGVHDNFFELGGHSLLATQLIARIRDVFSVELPLRALFENPTVEGLAGQVQAAQAARDTIGVDALSVMSPPVITARSREGRRISRAALEGNDPNRAAPPKELSPHAAESTGRGAS